MPPRSLAEFTDELAEAKLLARVAVEVDPGGELAAIAQRSAAAHGPAILFERVAGRRLPVLANGLATSERMCRALGVETLDEAAQRIATLWKPVALDGAGGWLGALRMVPQLAQQAGPPTKLLKSAPCQQVVRLASDVDLGELPVPVSRAQDAGPALDRVLAITRDPLSAAAATSLATLQILDGRTLAVRWPQSPAAQHYAASAAKSERLSVALVLGGDLCHQVLCGLPLPPGLDPLVAGALVRGRPLDLVRARTCDLDVPAEAELVCEGYLDPAEPLTRVGPVGVETGFYAPAAELPRLHVTALTHRSNPRFPFEVAGVPEAAAPRWKLAERLLLAWLGNVLPEVVDLSLPASAGGRMAFVSIRKAYPRQGLQTASALWGLGPLRTTKLVVVVDAGIDIHLSAEVWRQVAAQADFGRDTQVHAGPADPYDHATAEPLVGTHLAIDATTKLPGEHPRAWPEAARAASDVTELVARRWKEYGLPG